MYTSRILQRLYLLDASSPDFLRHLYCLIQYDEKEQYLTSLQGSELARLVDFLGETLSAIPTNEGVSRQCVRKLQAICCYHATLPSSYIISGELTRVGDGPIALGAIADAWEGTYRSKKVSIKCLGIRTKNYQTLKKSFSEGAVIWKRLRHPNIVPFIGVTMDPLQIVSEWMPNGTLTEFVKGNPSASRIGLLSDVSEGLNYLHASHTIHGNLNGSSILVDHDGHARLTDFELSPIVRGMNSTAQANGHTTAWTTPEIFEGDGTITREVDVFAFGVVVIEVFTGRPPFNEFAAPVIISKIISGERPVRPQEAQELGLTDSMWDMTVRCWHQDPAQRPTMTEVVGFLREILASSHSIEADLNDFFQVCKTMGKEDQGEKAQVFADRLDEILDNADLDEQKRKQYLRYLRKLCSTSGVLPSSFMLPPAFVNRDDAPFASGGYSNVYKATFHDRPVVIKVLNVVTRTDREKIHRLLVKEVIGWKWLRHENILPFVGVMFAPSISIASEQMDNGNIMDFTKANKDHNRLHLLVDAVTGLQYLHKHDIVHGDLKGVNILIDSERRARLADFGLATIVDETTSRTTAADGKLKGTTRWMAPELFYPDEFGFTGELRKQLPSKETDVYAIGMTILEVLTGCVPFADVNRNETVILIAKEGGRPERPPSGFSDALWELLVATWAVQRAREPQGQPPARIRPSACTVLDQLKKCGDQWGKSINPLAPEPWREDGSDDNDDDDDDTIRPNATLKHSGGPKVSSERAPDVAKAHILQLSWILGMGIAILCATLAVRELSL